MVNREKYHGLEANLIKLINYDASEIEDIELINQGEYLKKHAPAVYSEMMDNILYKSWLDVSNCYIHILKYNHKPVGYVSYDVGRDVQTLILSHVYLLEDYRGKGLFKKHMIELSDFRFNKSNFILQIHQPNRFLINSLIKSQFLFPINNYGLCISLLCFFNIWLGEVGENKQVSIITPYYDLNLFSPVTVNNDVLIVDDVCDVDAFYFDAINSKKYHLSNENYVESLKEWITSLNKELYSLSLSEVGDCEGLFDRDSGIDSLSLFKEAIQ